MIDRNNKFDNKHKGKDKLFIDKQSNVKESNDKEFNNKEFSNKQSIDKSYVDGQSNIKQLNVKQFSDKQFNDKQSINKQSINKQSIDKQFNVKQPTDKQSNIKQLDDKQSTGKQFSDKQSNIKQFNDKQSNIKQFNDKQSNIKQFNDKQSNIKQLDDKQSTGKQFSDKQSNIKQSNDKQFIDKRFNDKQSTDKQSTDKQSTDKQFNDKQSTDKQSNIKQFNDKQSTDKQFNDKQSIDKQSNVKQFNDKQSNVKQFNDKLSNTKQFNDKQFNIKQSNVKQFNNKPSNTKQSNDRQPNNKQSDIKQFNNKQSNMKQFNDKQFNDRQFNDKYSNNRRSSDKYSNDKQSNDKQSNDEQSNDRYSNDKQFNDKQFNDKYSNDKQCSDKQSNDKQSNDEQSNDKELNDKQLNDKQSNDEQSNDKEPNDKQLNDKQSDDKYKNHNHSHKKQPKTITIKDLMNKLSKSKDQNKCIKMIDIIKKCLQNDRNSINTNNQIKSFININPSLISGVNNISNSDNPILISLTLSTSSTSSTSSNQSTISTSLIENLSVYTIDSTATAANITLTLNIDSYYGVLLTTIASSAHSITFPPSNSNPLIITASFPIGTTSLNIFVLDNNGNTNHSLININILNILPPLPILNRPNDITVNTDPGVGTAIVSFPNICASTVPGVTILSIISKPVSGTAFNIGTTPVTFTAIDSWQQTSTCIFNVTVIPNQSPTVIAPNPVVMTAISPLGTTVNIPLPQLISPYPGNYYFITNNAPTLFPIGTTIVTFTIIDSYNLISTCTTTVTMNLPSPPIIYRPSDINVLANDPNGTIVDFIINAESDSDPNPIITCSYPSGSIFPIGKTVISCTASDWFGQKSSTCTFNINVNVPPPPVINKLSDIIMLADETTGTIVDYNVVAISDSDPNPIITYNHIPGSEFPIGKTTVSCIASDWFNQQSLSRTFDVIIYKPLDISCIILSINREGTRKDKLIRINDEFTINSSALDGYGPYKFNSQIINGDISFISETNSDLINNSIHNITYKACNIGNATIRISICDYIGNSKSYTNTIIILPLPPVINCIDSQQTILLGQDAHIQFTADGYPDITFHNSISYPLPLGMRLNTETGLITGIPSLPGIYPIEIYASNNGGDSNKCKFTLNVPAYPTLECPGNIIVNADTINGSIVFYILPIVTGANVNINCIPMSGTLFPIKVSTVNCIVTDSYNQQATCSFTVTVRGFQETKLHLINEINTEANTIKNIDNDIYLKLNEVINSINASLNPSFWKNNMDLNDIFGYNIFENGKNSVNILKSLIKTVSESENNIIINNTILIDWIQQLTKVYQLITEKQILSSISNRGNPNKIQQAQNSFINGKTQFNQGKWANAINSFKDTWNKAIDSLK